MLFVQAKAVFLEAGFWGTVLCFLLEGFYHSVVSYLRNTWQLSDAAIYAFISSASHTILYVSINIPFGYMDYHGLMQDRKLYRNDSSLRPNKKLITETLIGACVNQFVAFPLVSYYGYPLFQKLGMKSLDVGLPSVSDVFWTMVVGHVFNDVFFYLTHRMFHSKALYFLHKQHHSFGGTMGIAAEHANPVESVVANVIPTVGGVLLFGCHHPLAVVVWTLVRVQQTLFAHSGYCFTGTIWDHVGLAHCEEVIFHDHHHASNQGNFGCLFMDWVFGTMDHFVYNGGFDGYLEKSAAKKVSSGKKSGTAASKPAAPMAPLNEGQRVTRSRSRPRA